MKELELIDKVARRLWGVVAWNAGINPTMDGVPITYDDGDIAHRAFCRTCAELVIEEIEKNTKEKKMEANRREQCDFDVNFNGEIWHIDMVWMLSSGEVCWYDGIIYRDGVAFHRTFGPSEINIPKIQREGG